MYYVDYDYLRRNDGRRRPRRPRRRYHWIMRALFSDAPIFHLSHSKSGL